MPFSSLSRRLSPHGTRPSASEIRSRIVSGGRGLRPARAAATALFRPKTRSPSRSLQVESLEKSITRARPVQCIAFPCGWEERGRKGECTVAILWLLLNTYIYLYSCTVHVVIFDFTRGNAFPSSPENINLCLFQLYFGRGSEIAKIPTILPNKRTYVNFQNKN